MELPKVTIVTASFNSENTITDTIKSVLSQTYTNYEYLIIDGGSNDSTVEIIKTYESILGDKIKWISEPDNGIYDAWNKALDILTGNWVCFLGSDDLLLPDALENYVKAISLNTEVNFVSSKVEMVDEKLEYLYTFGEPWSDRMKHFACIAHVGSFHKSELFKYFGKFSTEFKICSDYEFLLRNSDKINPLFINVVTAKMRDSGVSNSDPYVAFEETYQIKNRCRLNSIMTNYLFFKRTVSLYKVKQFIKHALAGVKI